MDDLHWLSASELLLRYGNGTVSPVDAMEAVIARAELVGPQINAFADTYFDEARAAARRAEMRWKAGKARPLEGVPVAVKDAQRIAGKRTTHGSLALASNTDTVSDPMIERLVAAGAIIHARTTCPEFCLSGTCESRIWGVTRNPHGTDHSPGGSSGGSGAALAAGLTPLATGTDIGGSIRIPASCCGVVGFQPPKGRNPDGDPARFDPYNRCGPMARSVADLALMQNIVSGPHPRDHASLRERITVSAAPGDLRGLHIGWSMDLGYVGISPEVRANAIAAIEIFRELGAVVEEVALTWNESTDRAATDWYNSMHFSRIALWHADRHPELLSDYALEVAEAARAHHPDMTTRSWEVQDRMYQEFGPVMERCDLFLCPTTSVAALPLDPIEKARLLLIDGIPRDPEYGWILTHQFNMLFNCPVMAVPSGKTASGLPTGLQIVGRSFDDQTVFRAATAYEARLGGWNHAGWHPAL